MSPIGKATTTEHPRVDTKSSPLERPKNGLLTPVESEDFAEFVRKLSKASWFCEVAEA